MTDGCQEKGGSGDTHTHILFRYRLLYLFVTSKLQSFYFHFYHLSFYFMLKRMDLSSLFLLLLLMAGWWQGELVTGTD